VRPGPPSIIVRRVMPFETIQLIKETYRQSELLRLPPPYVTRLVKLLYLADIEWRRNHSGEPIPQVTTLEVFGSEFRLLTSAERRATRLRTQQNPCSKSSKSLASKLILHALIARSTGSVAGLFEAYKAISYEVSNSAV
jgi:hypothetical protein